MKKKIGIFGGGIAGLTAADELSKRGFDVYLYEKQNHLGGLARSCNSQSSIPTEISWRGIGPFYFNMISKLKEIPYLNRSVFEYGIIKPIAFTVVTKSGLYQISETVTLGDKAKIGLLLLRFKTESSQSRQKWISINASEYLKTKLSVGGWYVFSVSIGPFIGIDPKRCSMYQFLNFYVMEFLSDYTPIYHNDVYNWDIKYCAKIIHTENCGLWSLFSGSSKDVFFDPWRDKLTKQGVHVFTGSELLSIHLTKKVINHVIIQTPEKIIKENFEFYILATSPFATINILENSYQTQSNVFQSMLKNAKLLIQDGPHFQVPFTILFDRPVKMNRSAFIFGDSPFDLTLYFQSDTWREGPIGEKLPIDKCFWSGTACISYKPGLIYRKKLINLTKEEFFDEVKAQLLQSKSFCNVVMKYNNISLSELFKNVQMASWHTFKFDTTGITTNEMKWVNSTTNENYRPSTSTSIHNFFVAGAHVLTSMSLYSMEGAVESGLLAANEIIYQVNGDKDMCKIYRHVI